MIEKIYSIFKTILFFLIPGITFYLIKVIIDEFNFKLIRDRFYEEISEKLKESKLGYFNSERIEKFLKKNGNESLTPEKFIIYKFVFSILSLVFFTKEVTLFIGLISIIPSFFIIDLVIILENKRQETDILVELFNVCDSLRIQMKGGIHITDALSECYLISRNKRLKKAFERVESILFMEHDLEKALLEFREHFNNQYVDSFVVAILQSEKTGKINQAMTDLADSFGEISSVLNNKRKKRIERKLNVLMVLVVAWILACAGYAITMFIISNSKSMWR